MRGVGKCNVVSWNKSWTRNKDNSGKASEIQKEPRVSSTVTYCVYFLVLTNVPQKWKMLIFGGVGEGYTGTLQFFCKF